MKTYKVLRDDVEDMLSFILETLSQKVSSINEDEALNVLPENFSTLTKPLYSFNQSFWLFSANHCTKPTIPTAEAHSAPHPTILVGGNVNVEQRVFLFHLG